MLCAKEFSMVPITNFIDENTLDNRNLYLVRPHL